MKAAIKAARRLAAQERDRLRALEEEAWCAAHLMPRRRMSPPAMMAMALPFILSSGL